MKPRLLFLKDKIDMPLQGSSRKKEWTETK